MDGGLILGIVIIAIAVGLIFLAGMITKDEGFGWVGTFVVLVVLAFLGGGIVAVSASRLGTIAVDNDFFQPDLTVGVPYEHLVSVQNGKKFVAIIKKHGAENLAAYFFAEKLPEGSFIKIEEGDGYKYVPYAQGK